MADLDDAYTEVDETLEQKMQRIEDALHISQQRRYPCEVVRGSDYYRVGGIEVIDYIKAKLTPEQYKGYLLGNIYKYSGRCQYKGEYQKDVKKLAEYTRWLEEHESNT